MRTSTKQVLAGALALLAGAPAFADHDSYNLQGPGGWYFGQRNHLQRQRIEQGWRRGDLSGPEALGLIGDQFRANRLRWHYMSDGHLSADEAADLRRAYNNTSAHIFGNNNNGERGPGVHYYRPYHW